jgi:twinkle protein
MDNCKGTYLHICEGEIDCMSLHQYGVDNVVSIPSGVNDTRWIKEQWDFLDKFKTIFLVFDNDEAGKEAIKEIVPRLGEWRCNIVSLPKKDVNECLMSGIDSKAIYQCLMDAHEFDFDKLSKPLNFEEKILEIFENKQKTEGIPIKYNKLNGILKGWRYKEFSIWTGRNSSGKSTFLNEIILDLCTNKEVCCIASLELEPPRLLRWMLIQLMTKESLMPGEIKTGLNWLNDKLWIYNTTDYVSKSVLLNAFEFAARKYACKHFFIDSLMKVRFNSSNELEEQKHFCNDLCNFKNKFNVHMHLVAHPRKSQYDDDTPGKVDVAGTGNITDMADNVFIMHRCSAQAKEKADDKGFSLADSYLYVKKNREWGIEGRVSFDFSIDTKNFREPFQ